MECIANMLLPPCMVQLAHHQVISYYSVTKPDSHTRSDSLASQNQNAIAKICVSGGILLVKHTLAFRPRRTDLT